MIWLALYPLPGIALWLWIAWLDRQEILPEMKVRGIWPVIGRFYLVGIALAFAWFPFVMWCGLRNVLRGTYD